MTEWTRAYIYRQCSLLLVELESFYQNKVSLSKGGVSMKKAANGSASRDFDAVLARADEALLSKKTSDLIRAGIEMALMIQKRECVGPVPELLIEKTCKIVCLLAKQSPAVAVDLSRRLARFAHSEARKEKLLGVLMRRACRLNPLEKALALIDAESIAVSGSKKEDKIIGDLKNAFSVLKDTDFLIASLYGARHARTTNLQEYSFVLYIKLANDLLLQNDPEAYIESVSILMTEHNEKGPVVSEKRYHDPYLKTFKLQA